MCRVMCVFIMLSLQHLWRAFNVCRVTCVYVYYVVAVAPSGELFMYAVLRVCVCVSCHCSICGEVFMYADTTCVYYVVAIASVVDSFPYIQTYVCTYIYIFLRQSYVLNVGFELQILLCQPPKCRDCRNEPPHLAVYF